MVRLILGHHFHQVCQLELPHRSSHNAELEVFVVPLGLELKVFFKHLSHEDPIGLDHVVANCRLDLPLFGVNNLTDVVAHDYLSHTTIDLDMVGVDHLIWLELELVGVGGHKGS